MSRGRVSYRMWAHSLGGQTRHRGCYPVGIPFDQSMNAEPSDRLATPSEKDVRRWRPPSNPRGKLVRRVRPQRTTAWLIALPPELYRGVVPLRYMGGVEV